MILTNVTPAQAGNYSVVVTNAAGTVTSSTAALTVQALPTFSQWESQPGFFTSTDPSITGPTAAPEGDSIPNLFKYLYNIDPALHMATSDRAALPVFTMATNGHLTFTFREFSLETGITINAQTSSDLQNWTTLIQSGTLTFTTFTMTPTGTLDPMTNDPYMEVDVLPTGEPKQFTRLNITMP